MRILLAIIQEMRPKQWTKNLLLFAGVIFAHRLGQFDRVLSAAGAFAIFCGLSGAIYLFNDIRDADSDRQHPLKRKRPIASGALSMHTAILAALVLSIVALVLSFTLNLRFGVSALVYFVMMILYSIWLKHVVIWDLMIVALGFVIRAVAGVEAIERHGEAIEITPWFITCVLFLALFIAICKRRHELVLMAHTARNHRPVLEHYSEPFLDQMVSIATAASIMSYALYVNVMRDEALQQPRYRMLIWTLPFVVYGIFRYLYLVYKKEEGGSPETLLLRDAPLLLDVLLWTILVGYIFYS